jgi:protein-S-isoprenylcysteine O-methyltransferase Ste14
MMEVAMSFYPSITLAYLNGFILMIPLLALRFGIPALLSGAASARLDYFAPLVGKERAARVVYLVSNTFLIFSPLFARVVIRGPQAIAGLVFYALGIALLAVSLWNFSATSSGLVRAGVYRFSRNPIYLAYFLIFIGTALLIVSWFHLALTLVYQVSVHVLILSEERWCCQTFGEAYSAYQSQVPRYL